MNNLAVCLVLSLAAAACGKANDVPALKAEAEGLVKAYQVRFDDLLQRANSIMQRGQGIAVSNAEVMTVSRMFATAVSRVEQCDQQTQVCKGFKHDLKNAPAAIAALKTPAELRAYIDGKSREWRAAFTEINADFDAVESWITIAEASRPQQVAKRETQPVVPPPPPPTPDVPPPPPAGAAGAGGNAPNK